jgi:hypothetical protein
MDGLTVGRNVTLTSICMSNTLPGQQLDNAFDGAP